RKISASLDAVAIGRILVAAACSLMNAESGASGTVEDGHMIFREYRQNDQWAPIDYTFEPGFGVPGHVMQTLKPYVTNDAEHDAHVVPEIRQALGFHQLIDVPILNRAGELLGCFEIHNRVNGRPFGDADVTLLESLAASAAVALENAHLLAEQEQGLVAEEENRQAMLYMLEDVNESKSHIERIKQEWVSTFDAVTQPIFLHDRQGRITRANRAYAEKAGMAVEEVIGKPYWQLFPKSDARLHSCEEAEIAGKADEELSTEDGTVYLVHSYTMGENMETSIHWMQDISERKTYEKQLGKSLEGTVYAIAAAVGARDPYTAGHQLRVADLACAIGQELGLDEEKIRGIHMGGAIHDIGKIHLPAEILSKPSRLTDIEYRLIQEHPQVGYDILKDIEFPWPVADIAHQHHERLDGSGYPQGLKGDEICLEARIVAVADVVEAMSSHRPYRAGLGIEAALAEIKRGRSSIYDAAVVDACQRLFAENKFSFA
ncbi:MAG: HD domain-containing phosphohydrolase, partial [Mariprofundus sp.]|nr:HD domain-containing phosphohydrolase [Mariprofundus sp.]